MAYVDELLGRGEKILYVARQHIVVLMSRIVTELALIALLVAAGVVSNNAFSHSSTYLVAGLPANQLVLLITFVISVIILIGIFSDFLRWYAEQYVLTDRRVIQITGVLSRRVIDSSLNRVDDVTFSQGVLGRMFNFGRIEILTHTDESANSMEGVAAPLDFKRAMLEAKYNYERGYGYLEPHMQASSPEQPAAAAQVDVHRTLEELAHLRDRGILSSDEFEAKKREILSRI